MPRFINMTEDHYDLLANVEEQEETLRFVSADPDDITYAQCLEAGWIVEADWLDPWGREVLLTDAGEEALDAFDELRNNSRD